MSEEDKIRLDKEFAAELAALNLADTENAHRDAEDLLCALLIDAGYPLTAEKFQSMQKDFWYA